MSWYKIAKKVGVLTERTSLKTHATGTSGTSAGIKKIAASQKRIFRVALMSCACLLMNTAATVYMSVVLADWSVSSDQWLTCTIAETVYTRNWANYGLHVGDRYFLFCSDGEIPVGYCFDCCCVIFCTSPPGYEPGDDKSEEAADRRRGLLKKVCSQGSAVSQRINEPWSDSSSV